MSCTARSEKRFTATFVIPVIDDFSVINVWEWQRTQPTELKAARPRWVDAVAAEGTGGCVVGDCVLLAADLEAERRKQTWLQGVYGEHGRGAGLILVHHNDGGGSGSDIRHLNVDLRRTDVADEGRDARDRHRHSVERCWRGGADEVGRCPFARSTGEVRAFDLDVRTRRGYTCVAAKRGGRGHRINYGARSLREQRKRKRDRPAKNASHYVFADIATTPRGNPAIEDDGRLRQEVDVLPIEI